MKVGIVGHGADKFTPLGEKRARERIRRILSSEGASVMISGHSPVGGIDIWAEEEATALGIPLDLKVPEINQWDPPGGYGFMARNLDIAQTSDVVHVIVVDKLPPRYRGRTFECCYHCARARFNPHNHVKSGACWTGHHAAVARWYIVRNEV